MRTFRFSMATVALAAALLAGQTVVADEPIATVKGVVTHNGKPVEKGRIFFHLDKDQFVGAKIKDGRFAVERVPVGSWRITVEGQGVPGIYQAEERTPLRAEIRKEPNHLDLALQ
jgi:hypothetical protein